MQGALDTTYAQRSTSVAFMAWLRRDPTRQRVSGRGLGRSTRSRCRRITTLGELLVSIKRELTKLGPLIDLDVIR
jgi:hypothetical protein